jgi:hypothetical protein
VVREVVIFGFLQHKRRNGRCDPCVAIGHFHGGGAIGDSMNKKDSGLSVRTELKNTTDQSVDYSPKEYTWSQSLVIGLKLFLVVGAIMGLLWGVEKFLYK